MDDKSLIFGEYNKHRSILLRKTFRKCPRYVSPPPGRGNQINNKRDGHRALDL